jgi:hypothetical protein
MTTRAHRLIRLLALAWIVFLAVGCPVSAPTPAPAPAPVMKGAFGQSGLSVLTQTAWFIDPQNVSGLANDGNSGATALLPLLTTRQFFRRSQGTILSGAYTVTYLSGYASSGAAGADPFVLDAYVDGCALDILGPATTVVRSGTISAVTAINAVVAGGDGGLKITDGGVASWTADVGRRLIITNGARIGDVSWVGRDRTGGVALVGTFTTTPANPFAFAEVTPQVGDTYNVETLATIQVGVLSAKSITKANQSVIRFKNLNVSTAGLGPILSFDNGVNYEFAYSIVGSWKLSGGGYVALINCNDTGSAVGAAMVTKYAGFVSGGVTESSGGFLSLNANHLIVGGGLLVQQGSGLIVGGSSLTGNGGVAVYNAGSPGIRLYRGSWAEFAGVPYGASNSSGLSLQAGAKAAIVSGTAVPTITGSGGDFLMGGSFTARAFNETTGIYTAAIASTWANFATSVAGGGFGGNAHNVTLDSHLLTEVSGP